MSKYLLLYRADQSAAVQMAESTPDQQQAGMEAWMAWFGKAGSAIVDGGSPVGGGDGTIGGYSIVEADNDAAVQSLLEGHPHLEIGTIDVHPFLAMPGM